jgi:protein ImuB
MPLSVVAGLILIDARSPSRLSRYNWRRQRLAATDWAARSLGLRPGMPLAQAQAMVPGLTVRAADPEGDSRALGVLAAWCLRYAPLTAPDRPDGIWIEATGAAHLFGGEARLLADIVERFGRRSIAARAAIAETPGAAWAVARYADTTETVVPAGEAAAALHSLPIVALRLPHNTAEGLARFGFERIGQLMETPRAPLALRFGRLLSRRLDEALGRVFEPIDRSPRRRLSAAGWHSLSLC